MTVVSETKLTVLATVDGQSIALSVHIDVRHDVREAARRAGPSATAVACYYRSVVPNDRERILLS